MEDLRVDEYGNTRDASGNNRNPIQQHYGHTGGVDAGGYTAGTGGRRGTAATHEGIAAGGGGQPQQVRAVEEHHSVSVMLHRSGSSSSSSSEDDGMGGRRKKKGMKEKIKEKLPGGHSAEEHGQAGYGATTTALPTTHGHQEKKGMMEKIKEKLPGHH